MYPDPQDPQTFARSKLKWDEVETGTHADMLSWYKQLIALRKQFPCLTDGLMDEVDTCYSEPDCWFVVTRGEIQVACNLGRAAQQVPVASDARQLLASNPDCRFGKGFIEMAAESVVILGTR